MPTTAFKDVQSRIRVQARSWLPIATRYVLRAPAFASVGSRYIVNIAPLTPNINAPVAGGIYTALTLSATAADTPGDLWYGRWEVSKNGGAFTLIGNGSLVAQGTPSLLVWDLGPLDPTGTYQVRVTAWDAAGSQGPTTTMVGTFQVDHVSAPTLTAPADASLVDQLATQAFSWTFNDPDAGQTQFAYALRRTRGATGVQSWWRASDSSWQAIETWNVTATANVTIPVSGWNPNTRGELWTWTVATKDSMTAPGPYAAERSIRFTTAIAPTIVNPSTNLTTQSRTLSWTVAEQTKYRARLLSGGGFTTVVADTGIVVDALARSVVLAGAQTGTTVRFELTTFNVDGYASVATVDRTVTYTGPTAPTAVGSTPAGSPRVRLVITNPAGGDTFASNTIYRSDDGGVTYAIIATGIAANATYDDYAVGAGRTYSYKVRAIGTGDTFTDSAVI